MIIRHLKDMKANGREVSAEGWTSRRLLLRGDKMGFSMHDTIIHKGAELHMQYLNHLEAVYCVQGKGSIEDLATGEVHPIEDGTFYGLDKHDDHILRAEEDMRMICTFNPAVVGTESHGANKAYPLLDDDGNVVKE